jgi:hypothetical protein
MCSNYRTVTRQDHVLTFFGIEGPKCNADSHGDIFPLGLAHFIRLAEDGSGNRVIDDGHFGLLPHFAKEVTYGRRTYNS